MSPMYHYDHGSPELVGMGKSGEMMVGGGVMSPWGAETVVETLLECWADGSSNTVSGRVHVYNHMYSMYSR